MTAHHSEDEDRASSRTSPRSAKRVGKDGLMRQKRGPVSSSRDFFVAAGERIKKDAQTAGGVLGLAPAEEEAEALADAAEAAEAPAAAPEAQGSARAAPTTGLVAASINNRRPRAAPRQVRAPGHCDFVNGDGTYPCGRRHGRRPSVARQQGQEGRWHSPGAGRSRRSRRPWKAPPPKHRSPSPSQHQSRRPRRRASLTAMLRGTTTTRGTAAQERA